MVVLNGEQIEYLKFTDLIKNDAIKKIINMDGEDRKRETSG